MTTIKRSTHASKIVALLVIVAALFVSFLIGSAGALFGWFGQVLLLSVALPAIVLLLDYRIGLLALVLIVPFANARFIPKAGPLSIVNVMLLGVIMVFLLRLILDRMVGKRWVVPIPKEVLLCFAIPLTLAFVVGTFHLKQIPEHMVSRSNDRIGSLSYYWISLYLKSFLLYSTAFLIAASIVKYRDHARYIKAMMISAPLVVVGGLIVFLVSGSSLEAAVRSRQMFSPLGLHANEMAGMLLPALGVALFLREDVEGQQLKLLLLGVIVVIFIGILLTGSRAGFLGLLAVAAYYVWKKKRFAAAALAVLLLAVGLFLAPAAITDRLFMGIESAFDDSSRHSVAAADDQLTSGRFFIYSQLLPDFFRSPVYGNGMTSTLWSTYVRNGNVIGHPHNMYIAILLDMGVLGALLILAYFIYVWKLFTSLSRSEQLSPTVRAFFAGSAAGFIGFLTRGIAGGDIYPNVEIWFLIVSLGIAFGCQRLLSIDSSKAQGVTSGGELEAASSGRLSIAKVNSSFWR